MAETPPPVSIKPARQQVSGASFIWVIPLLALVVALGVAWQSYNARGPIIVVTFQDGSGISAGETELKYREITVGKVEYIGFSEGLGKVEAHIRVEKEIAPYIDSSSVFWIVQPEVSAQGVSGLSTVLSGVYIEGSWDNEIGIAASYFTGADKSPLIKPGEKGLQVAFRTTDNGNLTDNAPILFRGIEVGQVGRAQIARGGAFAIVEGLIYEEHRSLISSSTRFWDTSGFSVSFGPQGAEIDFSSLATLVGGGITFDTFVSGGEAVQDGHVFDVYESKEVARNSLFSVSEVEPLRISAIFDENVSGLTVGAPVELSGFKIGEVDSLSGVVDFNQFGDSRVRLNVMLSIQPARLGLPVEVTPEAALALLQERVADGLRARLASASLLTGGLKVELIEVPDAPSAALMQSGQNLPVMPVTESLTSDASATVEGVINRINNLPVEELMQSAIAFLDSAETLVSSDDIRETPGDLRTLLADLSDILTSEDVRNVPVSLNATLRRVEGIVTELEQQRIAEALSRTLNAASDAADTVSASVEGVPALVTQLEAVAAKVEGYEINALLTELTEVAASADALINSDETKAIPGALIGSMDELNALIRDLSGLATSEDVRNVPVVLNATLRRVEGLVGDLEEARIVQQLSDALASASQAANDVTSSVEGVPELVDQLQSVATKADSLELNALLDELTRLTASADALISNPDMEQLPAALAGALDEVNRTLAELRKGGAVANVNQTLTSTRNAADSIAASANTLPEVVNRLTALFAQASRAIEGYDQGEQLSRSAEDTLRDISQAANALAKLARAIERNPNSLLLGR